MFYEFGDAIAPVPLDKIDSAQITAGFMSMKELEETNETYFGFPAAYVAECRKPDTRFRSTIQVSRDSIFSILSVRDIADVYGARDRVGLFVRKNLLLLVSVVDKDDSIERCFEDTIHSVNSTKASFERIICSFFEHLTQRDNSTLEEFENLISNMEAQIEKGATGKSFNAEILALRRKILIIRNYYEQLVDIAEAMAANEADIFPADKLHHFINLRDKMCRLSGNAQLLRDSLIQVREAYQASIAYTENQTMKVFTVVTTIFLPLTLLAGWYGMNFRFMPELGWKYGYLGVLIFSIIIVAACIIFFKL